MPYLLAVTDENGTHVSTHPTEDDALISLRHNYAAGDDVPGWNSEHDEVIPFVETQGVNVILTEIA